MRPAHRPASTIPVGALPQDQRGHFAPLLLGERRPELLDRALSFAVPALLAALVVTGTVVERHDIVIDARLAEVAAAAIVGLLRGPLLVSVAVAAVVTAALRALSGSCDFYTRDEWAAFLFAVKRGEFDHLAAGRDGFGSAENT